MRFASQDRVSEVLSFLKAAIDFGRAPGEPQA
jgi:hypothetical protein